MLMVCFWNFDKSVRSCLVVFVFCVSCLRFSKLQYCDECLAFLFAQVVICLSRCMRFVFRNRNIIMVSCVVCSHMVGFAFDRA